MLVASLMLTGIFLLGTHFGAAKLPFIDRHIYSILPGNFKPFWNEGGFNANLAGGVLALFLPSAMILAIAGESWLQRCIALITFAILAIMLLLAQSRGALIAVMISLPVMTILYKKHWLWFWLAIATTGVALLIVYGNEISFETILGNDSTLGDISSLQSRVELWSRAIYMIQDFPFTGVGLGMFEPVVKLLYPTFLLAPDVVFQHAHNIYFQTAAEMGIPGLIGHLALCSTLTILLVRRIIQPQQDRDQYRVIALGLFGGLLVYLVHGIFDAISFYLRTAFVIWIIFGLIVAISTSLGWNVAE
jgi:O-antigen ligase